MAAGEGGFSNQINGFNKSEVTEYIGKISKEKQKLEADLKACEDKLKAAVKIATEADNKVNAAKEESDKVIENLNARLKEERKKSDDLVLQIDDLKRKLRNSGKYSASEANADKRAEEIIKDANDRARKIIADAEKKAGSASAGGAAAVGVDAAALMNLLKGFQTMVSGELGKLTAKASTILNTPAQGGSAVNSSDEGMFENMDDSISGSSSESSFESSFENSMSGFEEFAGFESKSETEADDSTDMSAFDTGDMGDMGDSSVSEVAPLDDPTIPKTGMDEEFGRDLLAQTLPSSALGDAMQDLLGSAGGSFESNDSSSSMDFDMSGGDSDSDSSDSSASGFDAMNALLGQMSANLESAGGSADNLSEAEEEKPDADNDNPWADLQAQLNAMEKSGNFGSDDSDGASQMDMTADAPAAPSADDSSIWDFGDSASSEDSEDDMSADLFGSF